MAKIKRKILSNSPSDNIVIALTDMNNRLMQIENVIILHSKMLNGNILRLSSLIDILIKSNIITNKELKLRMEEILGEVSKQNEELSNKYNTMMNDVMNSDDMGHA